MMLRLAATVLCGLSAPLLFAQDCAPADITLGSQAEVDQFQQTHGPCNRVQGDLQITGLNAYPANVYGLSELTEIGGELDVWRNYELGDLQGLGNISRVGGRLRVETNPELENIDELSGLRRIGNGIEIKDNQSLLNIDGLSKVTGFDDDASLMVRGNPSLENIDGLSWVRDLVGFLQISGNDSLLNIDGLSNMKSATGWVWILINAGLTNVDGLSGLTETFARIAIWENESLDDIGGLSNLLSAYWVSVRDSPNLSDCSSLVRVLNAVDDGEPGPGAPGGSETIPDLFDGASFSNNAEGCNSVAEILGSTRPIDVITGSWFNPETAGEGFMVHAVRDHVMKPFQVQEGLTIGYFYGFDPEGNHFWLIGTHYGAMEWGVEITFDAVSVSGGTFEDYDPATTEEFDWGTFTFLPSTCSDGAIVLEGEFPGEGITRTREGQVRSLARVAGSFCADDGPTSESDSVTASWWDPTKPGQGFAFHKINEHSGIVYFYGFDSNGDPLWLIGVWNEPLSFGSPLVLPMNQVNGGTFQHVDPGEIVEHEWGTLELNLSNCESGQGLLIGIDGTQEFNLEQLAGTFELECE